MQTRYTFRAGAPSILRAIGDEGCRFQDQVLEMPAPCCAMGDTPPASTAAVAVVEQSAATSQPSPAL